MKISINTETEEIAELRHAVAIIEDAIKRRENPDLYEEEKTEEKAEVKEQEKKEPQQLATQPTVQQVPQVQPAAEPEKLAVEKPSPTSVEEPKRQLQQFELRIPHPMSYSQVQQENRTQRPAPMPSRMEERGTAQEVDISALSMSSYGESKEGRKMNDLNKTSNSSSSPAQSSSPTSSFSSFQPSTSSQSSSGMEPRGFEPRTNNKSSVRDIVTFLRNQKPNQPIQMSEIVNKARWKNISEQETRNLVSELQREGSI